MSNVIPGTDLVASEGVKSSFAEYFDNREAQEALRKAQETARDVVASGVKAQSTKGPRTNDKKAAALRVFEANKDKGNGAIAKMISEQLEITYANAYYYVTRVFKR